MTLNPDGRGPGAGESARVAGSLSFQDTDPCSGAELTRASLVPAETCMWLRYRSPLLPTKDRIDAR